MRRSVLHILLRSFILQLHVHGVLHFLGTCSRCAPVHYNFLFFAILSESDDDQLDDDEQGSAGEDTNNENNDNSLYGEENSSNNFSTPQQGQVRDMLICEYEYVAFLLMNNCHRVHLILNIPFF